jgi:purine nucleosidase
VYKSVSVLIISLLAFLHLPAFAQYRVIFDTDIDSDVDDVQALAMLHVLADQQKINFLGVVVTSDDPFAPLCVDAINQYYGRPGLPIGFLENQPALKNHSKYTRQIAEEFPRRLASHTKAPAATSLYRQLLSNSPDSSVIIVTVGHLSSLQNLLQSGADRYSSLSGKALVDKKVVRWICMGGMFPEGKEANFYRPDPASTHYCLREWTKPVTFCGWEVGNEVITGGAYLKGRLNARSPVYRAYELYNAFAGRPSWDQVAVFLLTGESDQYFEAVTQGYCQVNEDGSNRWVTDQDKPHQQYIRFKPGVNPEEIARFMDELVLK